MLSYSQKLLRLAPWQEHETLLKQWRACLSYYSPLVPGFPALCFLAIMLLLWISGGRGSHYADVKILQSSLCFSRDLCQPGSNQETKSTQWLKQKKYNSKITTQWFKRKSNPCTWGYNRHGTLKLRKDRNRRLSPPHGWGSDLRGEGVVATKRQSLLIHSQGANRKQPSVVQLSCDQRAETGVQRKRGAPLLARVLGHPMSALGELQDTAWGGGRRQAEGVGCQCGQGA